MDIDFPKLARQLKGELLTDDLSRTIYSSDASVYSEKPLAVACPRTEEDLITLVGFANENRLSLIPRAAGTSLAGQVVGPGIVVDVSRHMTGILEIHAEERYAWVQPGVILDELNRVLAPMGLFFGPEASTANRCMIGGMAGNNATGLHSLVFGSMRDHTLAVRAVLGDGSVALFEDVDHEVFARKCIQEGLEGDIYRTLDRILSDPANREEIRAGYPHPSVNRRNTGYALDMVLDTDPFTGNGKPFNFSKILCGSEGTLALFSAIRLNLVEPLPPNKALVCVHFDSLNECLEANVKALGHQPAAVELMDRVVLESTRSNHTQEANRFFLVGNPAAVLMIELADTDQSSLESRVQNLIGEFTGHGIGYAWPVVRGKDIRKVWDLRKAGLGSLANLPGDIRAVTVIEDIAVPVEKQPAFIREMQVLFEKYGTSCVYHAHVGTGEMHLRPLLNLKDPDDVAKFNAIARETLPLVKKYRGSLSGEHGDGRLRSGMIPEFLGPHNYQLLRQLKQSCDPSGIFNPGKITDPAPMDAFLRVRPGVSTPEIGTLLDFSSTLGFMRAVEKCNGSGDCRKSHLAGGTMCPSYQAGLEERHTTRARANALREYLIASQEGNYFDHAELSEILDLCLSCKACASECPSNVDMARLKAEFLQQWHAIHPPSLRTRLFGAMPDLYRTASKWPRIATAVLRPGPVSGMIKRIAGIHPARRLPLPGPVTLSRWLRDNLPAINPARERCIKTVDLFIDEFTEYQDWETGTRAVRLLTALGYRVETVGALNSSRILISKGLLYKARKEARRNVSLYAERIGHDHPLVGIEPSAMLGFRDEYPDLVGQDLKAAAKELSANCFLLDEFLAGEMKAGRIRRDSFDLKSRKILFHGHCHQKALASTEATMYILNYPENSDCTEIPSGCCGMAGAFGFEQEHFELSNRIGELVLFPAVRVASRETLIAASGTSCRQQILEGTGRTAHHPADILFDALIGPNA